MEMLVFPFWDAKEKLTKAIKINQKKLERNKRTLLPSLHSLEAKTAEIKRVIAVHGADFTLFSYLEKKATQANVRERIKYMNSSRGTQSASFEESLIDMKLDKITIKQLTDFLYFAESPADLVRIKKITINKMKESPEYLSAQLQISSFQPMTQQTRGASSSMNILKKKALWFTLYGIFITVVFLYLLFPSDIAKSRLEEAANSSDFILKMESLTPSLPLGIKMKNITLSSSSANIYFQGDLLDLQFNPFSFFQKNKYIGLSGSAYGGNFSGRFGLVSFSKIYPPEEGNLNFKILIWANTLSIKTLLGREITGKASGNWTHAFNNASRQKSFGNNRAFFNQRNLSLAEPFLGLNRIDFDRGEIHARLKMA